MYFLCDLTILHLFCTQELRRETNTNFPMLLPGDGGGSGEEERNATKCAKHTNENGERKKNHWNLVLPGNGNEQPNEKLEGERNRKKRKNNGMAVSLWVAKKLLNNNKRGGIDFSLFFRFLKLLHFYSFFCWAGSGVTNFATFLMLFLVFLYRTFVCCAGFLLLLLLRLICSYFFFCCCCCCWFGCCFLSVRYFFGFFFSKKERCILSELVLFFIEED